MKAFFSYSTQDAELVRAVGRHVGRPFVTIDYFAFQTGDELLSSIEAAIEAAGIFVLFASRPALASRWVKGEMETARYEYALNRLSKVLVYVTDDSLQTSDLPSWLRRQKYTYLHASRPIAREIRRVIDDEVRSQRSSFFVGRAREAALFQEVLAPADGTAVPRTLAVSGLTGIGRQTLLARIARDLLILPRTLRIDIESGDAGQDFAAKLADLVEPYSTPEASLRGSRDIRSLDEDQALDRTIGMLERVARLNELVVLYDKGGLLDNDGQLVDFVRRLMVKLEAIADLYVGIVTNRRVAAPATESQTTYPPMAAVDVRPLTTEEVKRLITVVARSGQVVLSREQSEALAQQARGYPPAVYFAVEMMKAYGPAVVLQDRERVISFRTNPFVQYLRSMQPSRIEHQVLRILADNSPLPMEVLVAIVDDPDGALPDGLVRLIDASLVMPDDSGWYRIADPVVDAVATESGRCTSAEYTRVADGIGRYLADPDDSGAYFALARVRFRALVLSGDKAAAEQTDALAADWILLAERLYHARQYAEALEAATAATEARPESPDAWMWRIRALIKEEQFDDGAAAIQQLRRIGLIKETIYFEGFLERHRGNLKAAADRYQRARGAGYTGIAIQRELALCYFGLGKFEQAEQHVALALERQSDNRYLIDLRIQIACERGDAELARDLLDTLDQVDRPEFAAHRRSRVEDTFGNVQGAYRSAKEAASASSRPPFEVVAQLALMSIKTGRHDEAQEQLNRLDALYPRMRRDIRHGLRCRAAIARGEYDDALGLWERLENKTKAVHLALRRDALRGKLDHTFVPDEVAQGLDAEIAELDARLNRVTRRALELF